MVYGTPHAMISVCKRLPMRIVLDENLIEKVHLVDVNFLEVDLSAGPQENKVVFHCLPQKLNMWPQPAVVPKFYG